MSQILGRTIHIAQRLIVKVGEMVNVQCSIVICHLRMRFARHLI